MENLPKALTECFAKLNADFINCKTNSSPEAIQALSNDIALFQNELKKMQH